MFLGRDVYKVLSDEGSNKVVITLKSLTSLTEVFGSVPSTIPATVVTPVTLIWEDPTLTTRAIMGSSETLRSVYCIKLPTVVIPGKLGLELLITDWLFAKVTTPTVATPTGNMTEGITFALNVLIPTKLSSVP